MNANIHSLEELKDVRDKLWDAYVELASTPITEYTAAERSTVYLRKEEMRREIAHYDRRIAILDPKIDARGYNLAQFHPMQRGTPNSFVRWKLNSSTVATNKYGTVWAESSQGGFVTDQYSADSSSNYEPLDDGFFEFTPIGKVRFEIVGEASEPFSIRATFDTLSGQYTAKLDDVGGTLGSTSNVEQGDKFRLGLDTFTNLWCLKRAVLNTTNQQIDWTVIDQSSKPWFGGKFRAKVALTAQNSAISQTKAIGFANEIYRQA